MTEREVRGAWIVGVIIAVQIAFDFYTCAIMVFLGRFRPSSGIRLLLTCVLFYFLWRGSRAARRISVGLYALAGVLGTILAWRAKDSVEMAMFGSMAAFLGAPALVLSLSRDVTAFLSYQRAKIKNPKPSTGPPFEDF